MTSRPARFPIGATALMLAVACGAGGGCGSVGNPRSDAGTGGQGGAADGSTGGDGHDGDGEDGSSGGSGGSGGLAGDAGAVDAARDGLPDAGSGACDPSKPFGAVTPAASFNSAQNDDGLSLSPDGLVAYISSDRTGGVGGYDLYTASRSSVSQAFGAFTLVSGPGPNTATNERVPRITRDGLKLIFFSNRNAAAQGADLFVSVRTSVLAAFDPGTPLANVNTTSREADPFLTSDEKALYFVSDRTGGLGGTDIYVSQFAPDGSPGAPRVVSELNSPMAEDDPVLSADGLTIYFATDRAGTFDIWVAHRSTISDGFGVPTAVTELNGPLTLDAPLTLSSDGCTLYFMSDRRVGDAGAAGLDLFSATRGR